MTINVTKIFTFTDGMSVLVGLSLCWKGKNVVPLKDFQYKGDNFL